MSCTRRVVYRERGQFAGWPANHGIWSWGNELLVGFSRGTYKDLGPDRHHIDRDKPEEHLLARSPDGGETWRIEDPAENGALIPQGKALHGIELPDVHIPEPTALGEAMDFSHPDFAMTVRMSDVHGGVSRFYHSYDRGRNWWGPFRLPDMGTPGIAARTDYLASNEKDCLLFLTAAKANGKEGRPFCASTSDGGLTWRLRSWIGPEPQGFAIMPTSARLSPTEIWVAVRRHEGARRWIAGYRSRDNGLSWQHVCDPVQDTGEGNPASLILLKDGRLCLTYGFRAHPFHIGAILSSDGGRSWGEPRALAEGASTRDIGYTRSVQRPDGRIVTVHYFQDPTFGPERYIEASIWDPD